ncbi:hypothetical protein GYMLUDRAFT_39808 [Collybiopsis luxurians FD-317 M1]|nr:hypothetical protein GYMLUDRAFT_39808 [Collybiopsis luxurians FD-317 M1]
MSPSHDHTLFNLFYQELSKPGNEEIWSLPMPKPVVRNPIPIDERTEPPPPIPPELENRRVVYGFPWSDEIFAKFGAPSGQRVMDTQDIMYDLGILWTYYPAAVRTWVNEEQKEGLVPFCSFTTSDLVKSGRARIPIREKLEELCRRLGIDPEVLAWWERVTVGHLGK